ncbi:unnamed protein product, partial [Rotaria magnacalcarata]
MRYSCYDNKKYLLITSSSKSFENNHECRRGLFCGTNADGDDVLDSGRQPLGSIRLSLGWMSRYEDIQCWI